MAVATRVKPQEDLLMPQIGDPKLLMLLEEREQAKTNRQHAAKVMKEKHGLVTAELQRLEITETVRVGPFQINISEQPARSVAFDTGPRTVMRITRAKDA